MNGNKTLAVNIRILLDNDDACKEYDRIIDTVTTDIPIFVSAVCGINNIKIGHSIDVSGGNVAAILSYSDYQIIRAVKKMIDKGTLVVRPICGAFKITTISADLKDPFTMKDIENYIRKEAEYLIPFAFESGTADRNGNSITEEDWNKWISQYPFKHQTPFTIVDDTGKLAKDYLRVTTPNYTNNDDAKYYNFGKVIEFMGDCAIVKLSHLQSPIVNNIVNMIDNGDAYLGKAYLISSDDKRLCNLLTVYLSDKHGNAIKYSDIMKYSEKQDEPCEQEPPIEATTDDGSNKIQIDIPLLWDSTTEALYPNIPHDKNIPISVVSKAICTNEGTSGDVLIGFALGKSEEYVSAVISHPNKEVLDNIKKMVNDDELFIKPFEIRESKSICVVIKRFWILVDCNGDQMFEEDLQNGVANNNAKGGLYKADESKSVFPHRGRIMNSIHEYTATLAYNEIIDDGVEEAIENYHLFDKLIGDKFENYASTKALIKILSSLKKEKISAVRELKCVRKMVSKYNMADSADRDEYTSVMGLDYLCTAEGEKSMFDVPYGDPFVINVDRLLVPINKDYANSRIRSLELKLAFLNKNIKRVKILIKKNYGFLESVFTFKIKIPEYIDIENSIIRLSKLYNENRLNSIMRGVDNPGAPVYVDKGTQKVVCGYISTNNPFIIKNGSLCANICIKDDFIKYIFNAEYLEPNGIDMEMHSVNGNPFEKLIITNIDSYILECKENMSDEQR